jgi:hypothetical protein
MTPINKNAAVKCSKVITIYADSKKVWTVLTDIDNWDTWQTDISKSKLNGELKSDATFVWKSGGATIHSKLHTIEPFKQIGWTGKTLGMFAIHNWTLTEEHGKTEITVEESLEGFLVKFLKKAMNKNLEKGMENWLDSLKMECEKQH